MKRKYAALLLGLTLAISSTAAYAAQTESVSEEQILEENEAVEQALEEAEAAGSLEESDDAIYGKITEISETGITIELGTAVDVSEEAVEVQMENNEADSEENADASSEAENSEDESSDENTDASSEELIDESINDESEELLVDSDHFVALKFDGISQVISLTDDTVALQVQPAEDTEENEVILSDDEITDIEIIAEDSSEENDAESQVTFSDSETADTTDLELSDTETVSESDADLSDEAMNDETDAFELVVLALYEEEETVEISLDDLTVGSYVKVVLDEDGCASVITILQDSEALIQESESAAE